MLKEQGREKWFSENIGSHASSRNPNRRKGAVIDVMTNKMVADVNMFSAGRLRDGIGFRNDTSTLIITKNRERTRGWEFGEGQEKLDPNRFLNCIGQSIIL